MRIHIGTDHAAFELKNFLVCKLIENGYEVIDHGAKSFDALDDYPTFIIPTAQAVIADEDEALGIVLGGSGNGEQIAANKVRGIRAILATNTDLARLGREHNNANCLAMGGRFVTEEQAWEIVQAFIATPFSGDERHIRRIDMLSAYEDER